MQILEIKQLFLVFFMEIGWNSILFDDLKY